MSEPVLFNAMMAKTLTEFQCGGGILSNDLIPGNMNDEENTQLSVADFSYYKMRTMQCLQECLDAQKRVQIQTAAVLAIVFVIKNEVMGGSVDEIELHLGAFRRLIKSGLSLDCMSPAARSPSLFAINIACAVARQVPPLVPPVCSDTDLPERIAYVLSENNISSLTNLCQSFSEPSIVRLLGPKILCYISWQRNFVIFKELSLLGHLSASVDDFGTAASMMHRADYHLLSLPFLHQLSPTQEAVRLSLLVADVAVIIGLPPKTLLVKSLASQLKKAMREAMRSLHESDDSSIKKLLLWCCFIGAHVSSGLKERPWFLVQLIDIMSLLRIQGQDQVCEVLTSFLYTKNLFSRVSCSVWEEMDELSEDLGLNQGV